MQELKQKNKKITEERQKILGINDYYSASLHFLTFLFQCKIVLFTIQLDRMYNLLKII
jgi:hypothetical protein